MLTTFEGTSLVPMEQAITNPSVQSIGMDMYEEWSDDILLTN
jgi:hypothetical protein